MPGGGDDANHTEGIGDEGCNLWKNRPGEQPDSLETKRQLASLDSSFDGFWTDSTEWESTLTALKGAMSMDEREAEQLRHFIRNGYVVLENAVSGELCDAITAEIDQVTRNSEYFICRTKRQSYSHATESAVSDQAFRLIDLHVNSENAQKAMFAPVIRHFLELVFREPLLAFQSLTFLYGSQQGVHQDGAYVVVSEPLKFAASWIALEDVSPGSGELIYYPGSHRLPEYLFSERYKNWNPNRDGQEAGEAFIKTLQARIAESNLERRLFRPKKGDALIWAADLAHGGAKITNHRTRRSLVTHYCPLSVAPNYKHFSGTFARQPVDRDCYISSRHYDLRQRRGVAGKGPGFPGQKPLLPTFMGRQQFRHRLASMLSRAAYALQQRR